MRNHIGAGMNAAMEMEMEAKQEAGQRKALWKEWFWSKSSAQSAAARIDRKGYQTEVSYSMAADGRHDWQVRVFDAAGAA